MNVVSWLVAVKHAAEEALALSVMSPLPARKAAFQAFGQAVLPARAKAMATVTLAAKALRALEANPPNPDDDGESEDSPFYLQQCTKARRDLDAAIEACNAVG